ncbi:hypothetical protein ABIF36_008082 [Bradyrhizobium japonicum]
MRTPPGASAGRPHEGAEFRRRDRAVRQRHRPLEIGRADRRQATRADFLCAGGAIDRREGDTLDAFAACVEEGAGRRILLGRGQHAEQLHIVRVEHDGVVAGAHMRAVGAARRHREAELPVVLGGLVEVLHHDHGVVDTDDVLEGHCDFPAADAD